MAAHHDVVGHRRARLFQPLLGLLDEVRGALDDLTGILRLGPDFYPFQRA